MGKQIVVLFLLFCSISSYGQDLPKRLASKGLLRTRATLSAGMLLEKPSFKPIYIQGDLDYYASDRFSVRGDVFVYLDGGGVLENNQQFAGIVYHPGNRKLLDPFIGFQPGIAAVRNHFHIDGFPRTTFNPAFTVLSGLNVFAEKYFHLSVTAQYVNVSHITAMAVESLDEIRFSFGLGINLNVLKLKKG